jgi:hypothetical protein
MGKVALGDRNVDAQKAIQGRKQMMIEHSSNDFEHQIEKE